MSPKGLPALTCLQPRGLSSCPCTQGTTWLLWPGRAQKPPENNQTPQIYRAAAPLHVSCWETGTGHFMPFPSCICCVSLCTSPCSRRPNSNKLAMPPDRHQGACVHQLWAELWVDLRETVCGKVDGFPSVGCSEKQARLQALAV